jgi:hypothetical protein
MDAWSREKCGDQPNQNNDQIPYAGLGKGLIEMKTGDWIPDIPKSPKL